MQFEICPLCKKDGVYTSKWNQQKHCRYSDCNYTTGTGKLATPKKAKPKRNPKKIKRIKQIKKTEPTPEPHVLYSQIKKAQPRLTKHHWVTSSGRKSKVELIRPCSHRHKTEEEAFACALKQGSSHISMVNDDTGLHVMDIPVGYHRRWLQ